MLLLDQALYFILAFDHILLSLLVVSGCSLDGVHHFLPLHVCTVKTLSQQLHRFLPDLHLGVFPVNFLFHHFVCLLQVDFGFADLAYEHHCLLPAVVSLKFLLQNQRRERKPLHLAILAPCSQAEIAHRGFGCLGDGCIALIALVLVLGLVELVPEVFKLDDEDGVIQFELVL